MNTHNWEFYKTLLQSMKDFTTMLHELIFLQEVINNIKSSDKIRGLCHHMGEVCDGEHYTLELLDKYLNMMPDERYDRYGNPDNEGLNKFPHGKTGDHYNDFYMYRLNWLHEQMSILALDLPIPNLDLPFPNTNQI